MQRAERSVKQVNGAPSPFVDSAPNLIFIKSGCTVLDLVLGGGWPIGRIVNIVGDKSTGKTLLAIEAMSNFAKEYYEYDEESESYKAVPNPDGIIWYRESESAFNEKYAEALGMPAKRVRLWDKRESSFDTVEQFYNDLKLQTRKLAELNKKRGRKKDPIMGLYILDSLDALSDRKEMERAIDKDTMGQDKPRQMSALFRKITRRIESSNMCLVVISQVRAKIGISFGRKTSRSGGKALDFYASQVLYLSHIGDIKKKRNKIRRVIGVEIRAKCDKNKIALPKRECDFPIRFGFGVEDLQASVAWLKESGKLKGSGIKNDDVAQILKNPDVYDADDYKSLLTDARKALQAGWRDAEESFLPPRRKYE